MNRTLLAAAAALFAISSASASQNEYSGMVASHAAANGVPVELVHRVIMRESRYQPRAVSKGNYGMMQIRLGTARGMGYTGDAQGLLDPNTNLTYAVKYLAGAYKAANGNHDQAVRYYAAGYYYAAKRQGQTPAQLASANNQPSIFDAFAQEKPKRVRHHRRARHHH